MEKYKSKIIIIDDDVRFKNDPFIVESKIYFSEVLFFDSPEEGLKFIEEHMDEKLIVLLDLSFPRNVPDGHKILKSIRDWSFLIPVIIWSGKDEDTQTFSDLINNKAFAFLKKSASTEEIINKLIEADEYLHADIAGAIEDWITIHSKRDRDKPYIISIDGNELSLNDILMEVRKNTETGRFFSKNLIKLTIDLLIRNKERLND